MEEGLYRLGSLDVGSNTLRLLIAEVSPDRELIRPLVYLREITRLGTGLSPGGPLDEEAAEKSIETLGKYSLVLQKEGVAGHRGVATGALRAAGDGREFLRRVKRETGLDITIISGEQEAALSLRGVAAGLGGLDHALVFDVGGATTEFILAHGPEVLAMASLPVGVVGLTERHLKEDPPDEESLEGLAAEAAEALKRLPGEFFRGPRPGLLVGTAGTPSTLAAMRLQLEEYDRELVDGVVLGRGWLRECLTRLAGLKSRERAGIPGLEPGREDIIVAGLLVVMEIMEAFGFTEMTVSEAGLLEGVLMDLAETSALSRGIPGRPGFC